MSNFSDFDYIKHALKLDFYDLVKFTPLEKLENLSLKTGINAFIKREDLQICHSFKVRGALSKVASLSNEEIQKGLVCASAGNHAQGVAIAAKHYQTTATIVMPVSAPAIKINSVKALGAKIILQGKDFDEAYNFAKNLAKEQDMCYINAFDSNKIIAGQATCGLELIKQLPEVDYVFVPIGGGSLSSGIALAVKQILPNTKIIGVEPSDCASFYLAKQQGKPTKLNKIGRLADGVAVKEVGVKNFKILDKYLDDAITVDNDEICQAIVEIFDNVRAIAEPAGAVALAGMLEFHKKHDLTGKNVIAVLSGSNINLTSMPFIVERAEISQNKKLYIKANSKLENFDKTKFCQLLNEMKILECDVQISKTEFTIFLTAQTENKQEQEDLKQNFETQGFAITPYKDAQTYKFHQTAINTPTNESISFTPQFKANSLNELLSELLELKLTRLNFVFERPITMKAIASFEDKNLKPIKAKLEILGCEF